MNTPQIGELVTPQAEQELTSRCANEQANRRRWAREEARIREQIDDDAAWRTRQLLWSVMVLVLIAAIGVSLYAMARLW